MCIRDRINTGHRKNIRSSRNDSRSSFTGKSAAYTVEKPCSVISAEASLAKDGEGDATALLLQLLGVGEEELEPLGTP